MLGIIGKQRVYGQSPGSGTYKKSANSVNDSQTFEYFPFSERKNVVHVKVLRQNPLEPIGIIYQANLSLKRDSIQALSHEKNHPWTWPPDKFKLEFAHSTK